MKVSKKWKVVLGGDVTGSLDHFVNFELHVNSERVQKIASEHKRMLRCIHGMNPSAWDDHRLTLPQFDPQALTYIHSEPIFPSAHRSITAHRIRKEHIVLHRTVGPLLVRAEISIRRRNKIKHLPTQIQVIPHTRTSEVNVEVGVRPRDRHERVSLHLWKLHASKRVCPIQSKSVLHLCFRPTPLDPSDLTHKLRYLQLASEAGVADFKADHIEHPRAPLAFRTSLRSRRFHTARIRAIHLVCHVGTPALQIPLRYKLALSSNVDHVDSSLSPHCINDL
mmetsp:Transcript_202/g.369  ORF Transcript_202/g.369 Transcript_202/m.369 type:complete len:279 (-) Transcript_202:42-878(-)